MANLEVFLPIVTIHSLFRIVKDSPIVKIYYFLIVCNAELFLDK
jgi:hypothetical protein